MTTDEAKRLLFEEALKSQGGIIGAIFDGIVISWACVDAILFTLPTLTPSHFVQAFWSDVLSDDMVLSVLLGGPLPHEAPGCCNLAGRYFQSILPIPQSLLTCNQLEAIHGGLSVYTLWTYVIAGAVTVRDIDFYLCGHW